jgi:hypothetical protein
MTNKWKITVCGSNKKSNMPTRTFVIKAVKAYSAVRIAMRIYGDVKDAGIGINFMEKIRKVKCPSCNKSYDEDEPKCPRYGCEAKVSQ